jgi:hypothetical protein
VTDVLDPFASGLSPEQVLEALPDLELADVSARPALREPTSTVGWGPRRAPSHLHGDGDDVHGAAVHEVPPSSRRRLIFGPGACFL